MRRRNTAPRKSHAQNLPSYKYEVTLPSGSIVTRKTTREYTHVVVSTQEGSSGVLRWAGSLKLAQDALKQFNGALYTHLDGTKVFPNVSIVPVNNPRPAVEE